MDDTRGERMSRPAEPGPPVVPYRPVATEDSHMSENVELIYEHTGERHLPTCPFVIEYGWASSSSCTCPQIVGQWDSHDKMQATIDSLTARLEDLISPAPSPDSTGQATEGDGR